MTAAPVRGGCRPSAAARQWNPAWTGTARIAKLWCRRPAGAVFARRLASRLRLAYRPGMNTENPFPGMNPWLETRWPGVHLRIIALMLESLGSWLPADLVADGEVRVDVSGEERAVYRADVALLEAGDEWKRGLPANWRPEDHGQPLLTSEPVVMRVDPPQNRWVEIRTGAGDLVTVIELLSPANKGSGRLAYVAKRSDFLSAGVNVVEVDLVRSGQHTINVEDSLFGHQFDARSAHSVICVTRPVLPHQREVYYCPLRERLPTIRVPLRVTDHDVALDLQALVNRCYTTGRYWKLDYRRPPVPPLSPDEAAWADACLAEAGLLSAGNA